MPLRSNETVAALFDELALLTELEEGSPQAFRVRAYSNAARAIRSLPEDVAEKSASELANVKGIGKSSAAKIRQFVDEGRIDKLDQLREHHPEGQRRLLSVPGLGPKTIQLLDDVLGVRDVDGLRSAIEDGKLDDLPGIGPKTVDNLRTALDRLDTTSKDRRSPIADVAPLARSIVKALEEVDGVERAEFAGSLRRFRETIGDVDVLVAADDPRPVTEAFVALPAVADTIGSGDTKTLVVTHEGLQVDLRVVRPGAFGAALVYFTGSKAHNIRLRERAQRRGLTLNEYALAPVDGGDPVAARTEEDVYAALDLPWITPELREDDGEIEAAEQDDLPGLIDVGDIRGDLHDHSTYSGDGKASMEDMVAAASDRGWEYLALTDHAENLRINGVNRAGMLEQRTRLRKLNEEHPDLELLHGAELNIDPDGDLDYDAEFLATFDWCVASVHSHFRLPAERQTERLIRAMRNPAVNAIGHLSGRMIGKRDGIDLDVGRVLDVAAETGTLIEVNSNLRRLDAEAAVIREGVRRGVTFVISTDAHSVGELDMIDNGVRQARRGWLSPDRVANTWPRDRFLDWVRKKRSS